MNTPPIVVRPSDVTPGPRRVYGERRRDRGARRREQGGPVNIGLWIPTTAIFGLLAPFALMLTPLLYLAPRDIIPNPPRVIVSLGAVLLSLSGTVVEVDAPDCHVRLRLF